ncbi:acetyltransferase (GNAT) family protein [Paenibacillus cellulosilyticus]|uniref:Acetyltransferase (GNAT) family protein n=1 Tax=Paenibacillus cellulosilyticus TaxID=375489 RepID=A0A2V2YGT3_9BACL|nr:GNAT family N-acetyltransferase [Paenibacillus cellulosilyticus]PWV90568.1 acetyltransferase (GNAT) family protein [Paenibacillus cellulosilyticus]QKS46773.1 GNAT family N-acetyltransferase [Paenibacillus cellulosilyticus]
MDIVRLKPSQWLQWRSRLVSFAKRFGDRRLTAGGLHALQHAGDPLQGVASSTITVAIAHEAGKLIGFAFAKEAGEAACVIAVRPEARGHGVGRKLIAELIEACDGSLCCFVACDNAASMQLFFRAGLKAVGLHTGPTGKPTLRFETDGFKKNPDVQQPSLPVKEANAWQSPC